MTIQDAIDQGFVSKRKHPDADLWILNYTARTQYERVWNETTRACRGLIVDGSGNVVARPFEKFFNIGEHDSLPAEPFEVYEKLDGSLGIMYWLGDTPFIATRGSFDSDQAQIATAMLRGKYAGCARNLHRSATHLFEIIYPENRIVVDYGDRSELVLLASLDTESGRDLRLRDVGFPIAHRYNGITALDQLSREGTNREGYVLRFEGGLRVKVKLDEYVRLHKIITGVSARTIWEHLSGGQGMDEMLDVLPDEFHAWATETAADLLGQYNRIEAACRDQFIPRATRKESALYFQQCAHPSVLFAMLDDKDYSEIIWKMIRPACDVTEFARRATA